jgi:hypothetical protein
MMTPRTILNQGMKMDEMKLCRVWRVDRQKIILRKLTSQIKKDFLKLLDFLEIFRKGQWRILVIHVKHRSHRYLEVSLDRNNLNRQGDLLPFKNLADRLTLSDHL